MHSIRGRAPFLANSGTDGGAKPRRTRCFRSFVAKGAAVAAPRDEAGRSGHSCMLGRRSNPAAGHGVAWWQCSEQLDFRPRHRE